jgi:hypothetical protein
VYTSAGTALALLRLSVQLDCLWNLLALSPSLLLAEAAHAAALALLRLSVHLTAYGMYLLSLSLSATRGSHTAPHTQAEAT